MYKSKFKKSRRTSPQRVSSSSFHQPLNNVNDNATDPVLVNEEGPSTSTSVAAASFRPPAAVVKPSAFRPQQIPQPKGIKRKSIFADLDFSDVNLQSLSNLPSFQLSTSLLNSFNTTANTTFEVTVPKPAATAATSTNTVGTMDDEFDLSDLDDDLMNSIEGGGNEKDKDNKSGDGQAKAPTETTNYSDLLTDDDFDELLEDMPTEDTPPKQDNTEQPKPNNTEQPKPSEPTNNSNNDTFVSPFQTASGKPVIVSNQYRNKGEELFMPLEDLYKKELACLIWNWNTGQPELIFER